MPRGMAAVYVSTDDAPFIVAETPPEVAAILAALPDNYMARLTLATPGANQGAWNGGPLFVQVGKVVAISPPKAPDGD